MNDKFWNTVVATRVRHRSNILELEGDALVLGYRHILRTGGARGSRVLAIVDNIPLCLGAVKGRARSSYLLRPLRRIAALSMATGARLCVRWVPSERNPANKGSRGQVGFFAGPSWLE
eukprot:1540525-Pyramimonas_sp.AAC.1